MQEKMQNDIHYSSIKLVLIYHKWHKLRARDSSLYSLTVSKAWLQLRVYYQIILQCICMLLQIRVGKLLHSLVSSEASNRPGEVQQD